MKFYNGIIVFMISAGLSVAGAVGLSGKVVNRDGSSVSGAIVKLLPANITTTTGNDGSFSFAGQVAISKNKEFTLSSRQLQPAISAGYLCMNFQKISKVEIVAINTRGQITNALVKEFGAGYHKMSLPFRGTGVYIYKVKINDDWFIARSTVINGTNEITATGNLRAIFPLSDRKTGAKTDESGSYTVEVIKEGYIDNAVIVDGNSNLGNLIITAAPSDGTITDFDNNKYQTVRIGKQVWTVENLRTTHYNDGQPIPLVTDSTKWGNFNIYNRTGKTNGDPVPQFCYYHNTTNADTIKKFGALYNWYVVKTGKLAPAGWHVPDSSDWLQLRNYLLKNPFQSAATTEFELVVKSLAAGVNWISSGSTEAIGNNYLANNLSGFSAIPAGYRTGSAMILYMFAGDRGFWWSSTEEFPNGPCWFTLYDFTGEFKYLTMNDAEFGLSVRLVKDNE